MAEIASIAYKPQDVKPAAKFAREPLDSAVLIAGYGIDGDRKGGHPRRQLNIISYETALALQSEGFTTEPGALGEQITLKGLDVSTLDNGDQIRLGESAVIEIVGVREPCERFEAAQGKAKEAAVGRVGVMARVISGGSIRVGDPVHLLVREP